MFNIKNLKMLKCLRRNSLERMKIIHIFLFLSLNFICYGQNDKIDQFVIDNFCFFRQKSLLPKKIEYYKKTINYKKMDSIELDKLYKSHFWTVNFNIYSINQSKRKTDIIDLKEIYNSTKQCKNNILRKIFTQRKNLIITKVQSYIEGGFTYTMYYFGDEYSSMSIMVKSFNKNIVRVCYQGAVH